jgi:hypothetical protein
MKASVKLGLVIDDYQGEACDVVQSVSNLLNDHEEAEIVSVEMTAEEQLEAFCFIVDRYECED